MSAGPAKISQQIALPDPRLNLAITGHRDTNPAFHGNRESIQQVLSDLFDLIERATEHAGKSRLHSLLAQGADLMAVELAQDRHWDVAAPLPFGRALNLAINAHPETLVDAKALLAGEKPEDPETEARAANIRNIADQALLFELAEQDEAIGAHYLESLADPENLAAAESFAALASKRATAAAHVMIEHSAIMIAIWDGTTLGSVGGTRHTMGLALEHGMPVIWIDAAAPQNWCLLKTSEALETAQSEALTGREEELQSLIALALQSPNSEPGGHGLESLGNEKWRKRSSRFYHSYRRVEAFFGGRPDGSRFGRLVQHYEAPEDIAAGSAAPMLSAIQSLPGKNADVAELVSEQLLRRFAWADGISTHLSDAYRGSMVTNFFLSTLAIVGGIAYLPLGSYAVKWPFALFEFVVLLLILTATIIGRKRRWHSRWFETRRVAEYMRHAHILLLLGVARAPWRWPKGANTSWPELYARNMLQGTGLQSIKITGPYLRAVLENILRVHVIGQRDYHLAKAERLTKAHRNLDRASESCFILALISVGIFLLMAAGAGLGLLLADFVYGLTKLFTFLGVLFPSLGGLFAGIRFFGDFERFAAISEVTAGKLDGVDGRISVLLAISQDKLQFEQLASLTHAVDDIVIDEIENWQAVFGDKQITIPV